MKSFSALRRFHPAATLSLSVWLVTAAVHAQTGLKVINPPEGGRAIYGQVPGETTEAAAMGWILRSLHKEFDDRPQVGKLFQVRGTQSVAAFFSLTNRFQKNAQLTGLMMVAKTSTEHVEGAVVYDQAQKFPASYKPLMTALFKAWRPFESAGTGSTGTNAAASPISPLRKFETSDHSAWVSLPEGWQLDAGSGGGTIGARGPNGEYVTLGVTTLAGDTRNPTVQQTLRTLQQGGLRGTLYAKTFYAPWNADLSKMYVEVIQFTRGQNNLPPARFEIDSATPVPGGQYERRIHLTGHVDLKDGKGNRELNALFCVPAPDQFGSFMTSSYNSTVPVAFAEKERATLAAILTSFGVNAAIVQQQANAYAAPVIDAIHEIGKQAAIRRQASQEAFAIHNSSVYERWDSQDKRSKEFENYQLGYSVVHDIPNNAHGTLWNEDADALVKHDPQRFEYVNAPDFWKGIDY